MAALDRPAGPPEVGVTLFHVDGGAVGAAPAVAGRTATAATAMSTAGTRRHHDLEWPDPLPIDRNRRRTTVRRATRTLQHTRETCSHDRPSMLMPTKFSADSCLDTHFDGKLFHCQLHTVNTVDRPNGVNRPPRPRPRTRTQYPTHRIGDPTAVVPARPGWTRCRANPRIPPDGGVVACANSKKRVAAHQHGRRPPPVPRLRIHRLRASEILSRCHHGPYSSDHARCSSATSRPRDGPAVAIGPDDRFPTVAPISRQNR